MNESFMTSDARNDSFTTSGQPRRVKSTQTEPHAFFYKYFSRLNGEPKTGSIPLIDASFPD